MIAWRHGSVEEVVADGVTGLVVDDLDSAVSAARRVGELDRRRCREEFETRFTAERMARDYVEVYHDLIRAPAGQAGGAAGAGGADARG